MAKEIRDVSRIRVPQIKIYQGFPYHHILRKSDERGVRGFAEYLLKNNIQPYLYGSVIQNLTKSPGDKDRKSYPKIEMLGVVPISGLEKRFREFEGFEEVGFGGRDFKAVESPRPYDDSQIKRYELNPRLTKKEILIPFVFFWPRKIDLTLASEIAAKELVFD